MSETTPKNAVFEKPKAMWVVGAWLSTLAAVLGAAISGYQLVYGASFAFLVTAWVVYAVGWPLSKRRWLALVPLFAWTLFLHVWVNLAFKGLNALIDHGVWSSKTLTDYDTIVAINASVLCTTSALLAGLATLSWRTLLWCAPSGLLALSGAFDTNWLQWATASTWHGIVFGLIVLWAVRTRTRRLSGSHCAGCGYDLAGIEGPVCPECGRARVMAAGPAGA